MKHDHVLALELFHVVDSPMFGEFRTLFHVVDSSMFGEFRTLFQGAPEDVRIWLDGYPVQDLYIYSGETREIMSVKKYLEGDKKGNSQDLHVL